jgi:HK97 family phage major capsid protein
MSIHDLRATRGTTYDKYKALAEKKDFSAADQAVLDALEKEIRDLDASIERHKKAQELAGSSAQPVEGQEGSRLYAQPKDDPYSDEGAAQRRGLTTSKGLIVGGMAKMVGLANGNYDNAARFAKELYGERHPLTVALHGSTSVKALIAGVGSSGGFIIPPEYINEIIELLRPIAVVRGSNPRTMPMPRGTMTLPAQSSPATAGYGGETQNINSSQPALGEIIASYKKLTALVPVSNDLMRFADPAADAFVRDDLVKVMALREDLAFLMGDGSNASPRGYLSFANAWAIANGGTGGAWLNSANSTAAVNGVLGGNFITSNETYTLATVAQEGGGLINKMDTANVPEMRRKWFMHPRTYNYLNNVQNSLGLYVYRDELTKGTWLGYPFAKSTQIPINIWDPTGTNKDCSFLFLVEMTDTLILDAMTLELFVSREGSYVDSAGATQSALTKDQTLIRAIAEHDFQMRHIASIAVAQFVRWAPSIS